MCSDTDSACPQHRHTRMHTYTRTTHCLSLVCFHSFLLVKVGWFHMCLYVCVYPSVFSSCRPVSSSPSIVSFSHCLYHSLVPCVCLCLPLFGPTYLLVCLYLLPPASLSLTPCFRFWPSLPVWWYLCLSGQGWMTWSPFLMGMCLGT